MCVGGVQPKRSQTWEGRGVHQGRGGACMEGEEAGLIKGRDPGRGRALG